MLKFRLPLRRLAAVDAMSDMIGADLRPQLPGVQVAMSPAGRHFITLDDPA